MLTGVGLKVLAFCVLASPALAAGPLRRGADAPTLARAEFLTRIAPRAPAHECLSCFLREGADGGARLSIKRTPFLVQFNLVLKIDEHLAAPGRTPSATAASGVLRLSLLPPASPFTFQNREPQDVESLAVYVLELGELGVVATARQQGRGGLWAELVAGERVSARAVGFLTQRGSNATGAYWFGSHFAQLKVGQVQLRLGGDPVLFAFLSLEDDLTRGELAFESLSVLPGLGFGVSWHPEKWITATVSTGFNVGPWFDLHSGSSVPGYSVGLQYLNVQF